MSTLWNSHLLLELPRWLGGEDVPEMQEMSVWTLGGKVALEQEMATHSSILTWEIPRTDEPGELESMRSQKSQTKQQQQK